MRSKKKTDKKIRLVYILAASHSGSTLLAMLLGAHPEMCTVGELKATALGDIDRYRCSCRKMIKECPFWTKIGQEMRGRGFDFDVSRPNTDIRSEASSYVLKLLQPLHRGPFLELLRDFALGLSAVWRRQLPIIQSTNVALMESVLSQASKKVVVDSSKIGIRLKYLLKNSALEIKIIRLVRDGRAVSLTYMDPGGFADSQDAELRGGGKGGDRSEERLPMEIAAREWRRSNEEAQALLEQVDRDKWIEIRYEDLCREPKTVLNNTFDFIGVNESAINLDFRSAEHHVIGNGMRLDTRSEIVIDERWKTVLTSAQLNVFNEIAGELHRSLAYK